MDHSLFAIFLVLLLVTDLTSAEQLQMRGGGRRRRKEILREVKEYREKKREGKNPLPLGWRRRRSIQGLPKALHDFLLFSFLFIFLSHSFFVCFVFSWIFFSFHFCSFSSVHFFYLSWSIHLSIHPFSIYISIHPYLQSGTKPLEKIHKTRILNLNVGKERVKTTTTTPPPIQLICEK